MLNYGSLVIFTAAIFLNSRWPPDTMSVVIGTKFVMDRDGWSGKSLIINILLPFHICV